jgi:hypothetical protein
LCVWSLPVSEKIKLDFVIPGTLFAAVASTGGVQFSQDIARLPSAA